MEPNGKKKRTRLPKENKIRAELQKEINSMCPFCGNTDVGHFEIHHIDGNPSRNEINNLLLVCPTCHSKITKEDITLFEVRLKKETLKTSRSNNQEFQVSQNFNINSPLNYSVLGSNNTLNISPRKINKNIIQPTSIHITQEQATIIKKLIDDLVAIDDKAGKIQNNEDRKQGYGKYWGKFKKKFKITNYLLLPKEHFNEAEKWLRQQIGMARPKLKRTNKIEWRKEHYTGIYTRSKQKNIDKEELLQIAFEKFELNEPITSLKELSDTNLKKLYQYIFSV